MQNCSKLEILQRKIIIPFNTTTEDKIILQLQNLPVDLKAFKPIDIKNSNYCLRVWILPDRIVNFINKPEKKNGYGFQEVAKFQVDTVLKYTEKYCRHFWDIFLMHN